METEGDTKLDGAEHMLANVTASDEQTASGHEGADVPRTASAASGAPEPPQGYRYHPAANVLPLMTGSDFEELRADIKKNGLLETIKRYRGQIIDGRNRLLACLAEGVAPEFEDLEHLDSPVLYVVSRGLRRRHLTAAQRAAIAAEVAEMMSVEAKAKQQEAGACGVEGGRGKKRETPRDAPSRRVSENAKSTTRAARSTGAGVTATKKMLAVKRKAPDVFEKAKSGKVSIAEAEREAGLRPRKKPSKTSSVAGAVTRVTAHATRNAGDVLSGPAVVAGRAYRYPDHASWFDWVVENRKVVGVVLASDQGKAVGDGRTSKPAAGARGPNLSSEEAAGLRSRVREFLASTTPPQPQRILSEQGVFPSFTATKKFLAGQKGMSRARATVCETFLERAQGGTRS